MAVHSRSTPPTVIDLEATAELPAIDFSTPPVEETLSATDVFQAPSASPAGIVELADSLREVENRLERKSERLATLEVELATTRATEQELRAQLAREQSEARARDATLSQQLTGTTQALESVRADLVAREATLAAAEAEINTQRRALEATRAEQEQRASEQRYREYDLQQLRRSSERQLEALRSAQGYRAVSEAMIGERDEALRQTGSEHAHELGEALARLSAAQADLAAVRHDTAQRIAVLEESLQKAERARQAQVEALRIAGEHGTSLATQLAEREAALTAQLVEREATLTAQLTGREAALTAQLAEREAALTAQIAARDAALATQVAEHRAAMARLLAENKAALTTQLAERDATMAAQIAARDATITGLQSDIAALRAIEEEARAGIAVFHEQQRRLSQLQSDLVAAQGQAGQFETDLQVAEERISQLESEAHANAALLGNLQQNIQRLGREDTGARPALKVVAAADTAPRLLVLQQEDGTEVAYPLGRRTSIGRTSDNDIQIDTTWISRHHAVVLANAEHCVVEDLNSTNGVLVNGRRIGRQVLHDGDMVTVGKTEFRYQQRA